MDYSQNNRYTNDSHSYGYQDTSYHGAPAESQSRLHAPLPSVPQDHDAQSPFKSPYDSNYNSYNPSAASLNEYPTQTRSHDPFGDNNAIPLQDQPYTSDRHSNMNEQKGFANMDTERFPSQNQYDPRSKPSPLTGFGTFRGKKIPFAVYILSLIQIIVFIAELAKNGSLTGSGIEIHPNFNPMIGPSPYVLINMGARYVPCMRSYPAGDTGVTLADPSTRFPCPNTTTTDANCNLAQLCGFGLDLSPASDGSQPQPNQWFRFIIPMFMHAGIIHIGFNLLLQLTLGKDVERSIGTIRFLLVYFASGIFGFVFGGNFAPNGIASTGCSGALFGLLAINLLELLYTWKSRRNPGLELFFIFLDIVISVVIGLLPAAVDNFSHIGGFITGLCLGISILRSPDSLRQRTGMDEPPYASVNGPNGQPTTALQGFVKEPVSFFKGRKPLWWVWWVVRVAALVLVLVAFIVLIRNFYKYRTTCSWCKYLSCLVSLNLILRWFNANY
jgi:membrane associated rhomboid family serine protease